MKRRTFNETTFKVDARQPVSVGIRAVVEHAVVERADGIDRIYASGALVGRELRRRSWSSSPLDAHAGHTVSVVINAAGVDAHEADLLLRSRLVLILLAAGCDLYLHVILGAVGWRR